MFINVGAMFAPTAAEAVVNFVMKRQQLFYDSRIPELFHKLNGGNLSASAQQDFLTIAQQQDATVTLDGLQQFGQQYVDALGGAYQLGFGVACISLIISFIIFFLGRKTYETAKTAKEAEKQAASEEVVMSPKETKERIFALLLVFIAVIFFWMAFHQNGLTLTYFARDYTATSVDKYSYIWFDLFALIPLAISLVCFYFTVKKYPASSHNVSRKRLIYGLGALVAGVFTYIRISGFEASNPFTPQLFQHFNPFFIVLLTPLAVTFFNKLASRGKEPTAPRKIAYGMLIAGFAYLLMTWGSVGLLSPMDRGDVVDYTRVTPYWLISTYFVLTIAELFISPMGISFVSKVAPPKLKGLMQGGWFAATAIGNFLIQVGSHFWSRVPLWSLWLIFVVCCLLSALFISSIMKRLEKVAR